MTPEGQCHDISYNAKMKYRIVDDAPEDEDVAHLRIVDERKRDASVSEKEPIVEVVIDEGTETLEESET